MTASTPRRSRSACHSVTGCAPAYRTARAASWSSRDPGNVTTPIRTPEGYLLPGTKHLVQGDDGAPARRGAQPHVVHAGPHHLESPAGLGHGRDPLARRMAADVARVDDLDPASGGVHRCRHRIVVDGSGGMLN